jgi:hypothetical protein
VQQITGNNVELAYVDQGYAGENAVQAAARHGIQLEVVKHREARRGFLLLPAAGWSNAASPGPPASAAWPQTTNDSARLSKAFTTWPSPSSCSRTRQEILTQS